MVFLKGKSPNINGDMIVVCDLESQDTLRFVHIVLGARQSADEQRSASLVNAIYFNIDPNFTDAIVYIMPRA